MSTIMRRRRTSRLSLGPYRRHELLTVRIEYPVQGYTGYGDGVGTDLTKFIGPAMRLDWEANREALLAYWKSGMSDAEAFSGRYAAVALWAVQCGGDPLGCAAFGLDTAAERAMPEPDPLAAIAEAEAKSVGGCPL